jgi:hypothetical protein
MDACAPRLMPDVKRHGMRWQIATVRALAVLVAAFLMAACAIVIDTALRFNGTCGGLIPFVGSAQPCTLWQYVSSSVSFTFAVLFQEYCLVVLFFACLVFLGSAIFERFRTRQDAV